MMNGIDNYWWHCEVLDCFGIKDIKEIHALSDGTYARLLESEFNHVCEDMHKSIDFDKWVKINNLAKRDSCKSGKFPLSRLRHDRKKR